MHQTRLRFTLAATCLLIGLRSELSAQETPALKDVFQNAFMVGAALNADQFYERDAAGTALIKKHFNTIHA